MLNAPSDCVGLADVVVVDVILYVCVALTVLVFAGEAEDIQLLAIHSLNDRHRCQSLYLET